MIKTTTRPPSPASGRTRHPDASENRRGSEAGDTLIELLLALAVLGIVVGALLIGFLTSFSSSATYRSVATMDTVLRSAVEEAD